MRFVLDNDVDARVGGVLRRNGHDCWSSTAGLAASADDDAVTVYADNRDAVVITHDREFTQRRMRNTIGRHVRLNCEHPDGPKVIAARLAELVAELEEEQNIVLVVSASKVERHPARWE